MRILIVDDSDAMRRGVKDLLSSKADWKVCGEARNGDEGIRKARELRPDVILLDISMPGMNGLDVARTLGSWESKNSDNEPERCNATDAECAQGRC
jgi:YesN/AraC family two-component response regulator